MIRLDSKQRWGIVLLLSPKHEIGAANTAPANLSRLQNLTSDLVVAPNFEATVADY